MYADVRDDTRDLSLGYGIALIGCLKVPLERSRLILHDAFTLGKEFNHAQMSVSMTATDRLQIALQRLNEFLWSALTLFL